MDIGAWLRGLGLEQYARAFADNDIDAQTLRDLNGDDLKDIGVVSVGHRKRLLAAIAELSDRGLVGTMLTIQTSMGFLLTLSTVHLIPWLVEAVTWRYAFAALAIGPFLGVWAMARLRAHPDSLRLANGRR